MKIFLKIGASSHFFTAFVFRRNRKIRPLEMYIPLSERPPNTIRRVELECNCFFKVYLFDRYFDAPLSEIICDSVAVAVEGSS